MIIRLFAQSDFSSPPEPTSPAASTLLRKTEDSSPLAIRFSDSEKSSPAVFLQTTGMLITNPRIITVC